MHAADWIVVEPAETFVPQMKLRRKLLEDPRTVDRFYATRAKESADVLAAEREALEMLASHLERHGAASHSVVRGADGRVAAFVDELSEARIEVDAARPLWTAARVVQEDFILLTPVNVFVGGCACFSFMEIGLRGEKGNMKLGEPMTFIHRNVPGFNAARGVGEKVAAFFKKLDAPQARSNWLLVPEEGLDPTRYSLWDARDDGGALPLLEGASPDPRDWHLRVEFQSVSRLRESGMILFTLHVYSDPLPSLALEPKAAAVLRQAALALDAPHRTYRGMSDAWTDEVAAYLKGLAGAAA